MTPEQIALVQSSFIQVLPIADIVAGLFYKRLFSLDPALRALFPSDMRAQERKLILMLNMAVSGLSRLDTLVPVVQELGRRHNRYGVTEQHYDTVGAVLLWTLHYALRDQWNATSETAWSTAYTLLAETMKAACVEYIPA